MLNSFLISTYLFILLVLSAYGFHRYWILYLYWRHYKRAPPLPVPPDPSPWPSVTVQLPVFNEYYMVERLIDCVCRMDYPREKLEIQLLDDSTDDTTALIRNKANEKRNLGFNLRILHRDNREGFKAGALAEGLMSAAGEFIAIFDADFLPPADFLKRTIPRFADNEIGVVQTRWGHINANYSLLTRVQSIFLDGHFMLEHTARNHANAFINFNGTAGVWRKQTIIDAGGWSADTLTEDLDLSYRAQLRGWKFLFLPEVVCPAELPADMGSFRSQQHRWTKGAVQVACKLLPRVWESPLPFIVKAESTAHLTANLAYPFVLLLSVLLFPSLVARTQCPWAFLKWIEFGTFLFAAISVALFYYVAHRETGTPLGRWRWRDLPSLMAFGVGMCINNTRAIWEIIGNKPSDFQRTPKFNVRKKGDPWRRARYGAERGRAGFLEALFALYFLYTFYWIYETDYWWSAPLIGIFLLGYAYIGTLTLAHTGNKS